MSRTAGVVFCLALLAPLGADAAPIAPFFYVIPDLPGGDPTTQAYRVSADGSTAVGRSSSAAGFEATRWTQAEGTVALGDVAGGDVSAFALGTSADGSVVVGLGTSASGTEAFRWTQASGMVSLGDLPGGSVNGQAFDTNADGSVVVGEGNTDAGREAWRWTQATGLVSLGGGPFGVTDSVARGVSADGSVIIGAGTVGGIRQGWRWTEATGLISLGAPPNGLSTSTWDVSPDGGTVVGYVDLTTDTFAPSIGYRWTEAGGYELLPDLPGGAQEAAARGVSLNGEVAVGYGWEGTNEASSRATYWLADGQVRRVGDLLAAWGLDLGEMTLSSTLSVSDDGLVFVGSGWLPGDSSAYGRAWIAGVPSFSPPPPPLPEPGALALLGVGLVALAVGRRRRGRR
jgi:probable HAF family extracellular repeat protein